MKKMKINFACKQITIEEAVRCSFNLNKTEYKIFIILARKSKEKGIRDISRYVGLERTGVQKAIKKLMLKKVVVRVSKNLRTGGLAYLYRLNNKSSIKRKMVKSIDRWTRNSKMAVLRL